MSNRSIFERLLVAAALVSSHCDAAEYFLSSRERAAVVDVYAGLQWQSLNGGGPSIGGVVLEPRVSTAGDWDLGVRLEALHPNGAQNEGMERGDTTVSGGKAFRLYDAWAVDFVSIEAGYVDPAENPELSSGVEYFITGRLHGGPTLLGFDLSATYSSLRSEQSNASSSLTFAAGLRRQICPERVSSNFMREQLCGVHIGADFLYQQLKGGQESDSATLVQLVVMKRRKSGDEIYLFAREGLTNSFEDSYLGFGYRFRFER